MTGPARRDDPPVAWTVGGTLALRDESADDGLTIEGVAVPWGQPTRLGGAREYPNARETFERGAFAGAIAERAGQPWPHIDEHGGTVVGTITFEETDRGLEYRGRLLTSQAAMDYAERVRAGIAAVSLEFYIGTVRRVGNLVTHTRVDGIAALAGVYSPAYAGAFASVRSDDGGSQTMHCEHCNAELTPGVGHTCPAGAAVVTQAASAERAGMPGVVAGVVAGISPEHVHALVEDAVRSIAERGSFGLRTVTEDPFADLRGFSSLGHLVAAASQADASPELRAFGARSLALRAIADQLTTDSNAGVTTPGVMQDVHNIVSRGRPAITAFGGPRPLDDGAGMSVEWPYFAGTLTDLIGVQSTQKTEITSAKVEILKGTEAILTFAGGSDIAYQLIRRSSPAYLDVYSRILLTAWGVVTDAAFVTELESGSATVDFTEALSTVDATELKGLLIGASVTVETATGLPAEFVLASTTAFTAAAKLLTPAPVSNSVGTSNARTLEVNVSGLPIIHVPSMTPGKFIASNSTAAAWYEAGPFLATAEDVFKLGKDVAYWSMGAPARFTPAGILEIYDVTP